MFDPLINYLKQNGVAFRGNFNVISFQLFQTFVTRLENSVKKSGTIDYSFFGSFLSISAKIDEHGSANLVPEIPFSVPQPLLVKPSKSPVKKKKQTVVTDLEEEDDEEDDEDEGESEEYEEAFVVEDIYCENEEDNPSNDEEDSQEIDEKSLSKFTAISQLNMDISSLCCGNKPKAHLLDKVRSDENFTEVLPSSVSNICFCFYVLGTN